MRSGKSSPKTSNVDTSDFEKEYPELKVQLYDGMAIKQALDDSIVKYFTEELNYKQNHTLNITRVILGLIGCILAAIAQFYPTPFPKNKPILIACVFLYLLISLALYYIAAFIQKDYVLFAYKEKNFQIKISTSLPRFDPNYTIKIEDEKGHSTTQTKTVNNYFDVDGALSHQAFFKDLSKLHSTFLNSNKSN